jgi:hypothetical protein
MPRLTLLGQHLRKAANAKKMGRLGSEARVAGGSEAKRKLTLTFTYSGAFRARKAFCAPILLRLLTAENVTQEPMPQSITRMAGIWVAVGTRIAPRPPGHRRRSPAPGSHRTRRADFPHRALRQLIYSTASACSSRCGRRSLGRSNGVLFLIWLNLSHVMRLAAQLRLHSILCQ